MRSWPDGARRSSTTTIRPSASSRDDGGENGITFGLGPGAEVTGRRIEPAGPEGIRFNLVIDGIGIPVFLAAAGEHNVMNALAAAAASWALGFDRHEIAAGLAAFRPVPGKDRDPAARKRRLPDHRRLQRQSRLGPGGRQDPAGTAGKRRRHCDSGRHAGAGRTIGSVASGNRDASCGCKHSRPLSQGIPDEGFGGRGDPAGDFRRSGSRFSRTRRRLSLLSGPG